MTWFLILLRGCGEGRADTACRSCWSCCCTCRRLGARGAGRKQHRGEQYRSPAAHRHSRQGSVATPAARRKCEGKVEKEGRARRGCEVKYNERLERDDTGVVGG